MPDFACTHRWDIEPASGPDFAGEVRQLRC